MEAKTAVILYSDGACSGNPGAGGWGTILKSGQVEKEMSGFEADTTNNRMEMTAVIKGLQALNRACAVAVYSDSAYLVNAFNLGWLDSWQKRSWKNAAGKPVANIDLWQELLRLSAIHDITWHKVKGHDNDELNNRCDALAVQAIKDFRKSSE